MRTAQGSEWLLEMALQFEGELDKQGDHRGPSSYHLLESVVALFVVVVHSPVEYKHCVFGLPQAQTIAL